MKKIDISEKLSFERIDLTAPNIVIENLASQIKEQTKNIIICSVETYNGQVVSYKAPNVFSSLQTVLVLENEEIDIQESLGESGEEIYKYEFYLSTPVFEQYKYRIGFIQYGIANYPVMVVLEQGVADEISSGSNNGNYIYKCNNPTELEELIIKVIYSKKIIGVMQEIINIYHIYSDDKNVN